MPSPKLQRAKIITPSKATRSRSPSANGRQTASASLSLSSRTATPKKAARSRGKSGSPKKKQKGKKKKGSAKKLAGRKSTKVMPDILSPAAMLNLYYIAHNAPHALMLRGYTWSGADSRKGKMGGGKKRKRK